MDVRLPRLPERVGDGAIVAVVAAVGLLGLAISAGTGGRSIAPLPPLPMVLAVTQAVVLWWRRDRPQSVLAISLAMLVIAQAVGDQNAASFVGPHVAAYSVGAYGSSRAKFLSLPVMGGAALLDGAVIRWLDDGPAGAVLLGPGGVLLLVAWGIGHHVGVRRAYLQMLLAHNRHLEAERDDRARRAVLEERRRIARELHDQVAHHLGVVSLQTSAARRWLHRDISVTTEALDAAEDAARDALTTMPVILEALRTDADLDVDTGPQPSLADLDALIAQVSRAGLPTHVHVEGQTRPLDPKVELTAYRIIQEALTNTLKHAGRAQAEVAVRYRSCELDLAVTDDGLGGASNDRSAGHGLLGMRERVELLNGALSTGPRVGGGYEVRARLPIAPPAGS